MIIFIIPIVFGSVCQDVTLFADIPCDLVTPAPYPQPCTDNTFYIYQNTTNIENLTMALYGSNYCFVSFNHTVGDYSLITNRNDSGSIKVVYKDRKSVV